MFRSEGVEASSWCRARTDRRSLERFPAVLRDHQAGECFYCGKRVGGAGDLGHFIPWCRYPLDLGHNFVYAHKGCNNAKRSLLPAVAQRERWKVQNCLGKFRNLPYFLY